MAILLPEFNKVFPYILRAMVRHRREALVAFRDGPDDAAVVQCWAESHHLASEQMLRRLLDTKAEWRAHPGSAEQLAVTTWFLVDPVDAREKEWKKKTTPWPYHGEPLKDWRQRAERMWRELKTIRGGYIRRPRSSGEAAYRYTDWFVRYQVLGLSIGEMLARDADQQTDVSTVKKGLTVIARVTGVRLRRTTT